MGWGAANNKACIRDHSSNAQSRHGSALGTLTLAILGFSLISRCTHRAHEAFELIENPKLSFQSIMGQTHTPDMKSSKRSELPVFQFLSFVAGTRNT
jgi:hypothetical protein